MIAGFGGLSVGDLIEVDATPTRRYRAPHIEDHRWTPSTVTVVRSENHPELAQNLSRAAYLDLAKAFGKPSHFSTRGNPVFAPDRGSRSLATVFAKNVRLYRFEDGLRADFTDDSASWTMLPVEGIALRNHFKACKTCATRQELNVSSALIRVGLGRPFQPIDQPPGCFAQVNSVVQKSGAGLHS
jgi:hypothetical protein